MKTPRLKTAADDRWKPEDYSQHWFCSCIHIKKKQATWSSQPGLQRQERDAVAANCPMGGEFWTSLRTESEW